MLSFAKKIVGPIFGVNENEIRIKTEVTSDSDAEQNEIGAPVEGINPLGYNLDYFSAFYVVIQGIIGTGIFLTPASILNSIGSVGASYLLWVVGFLIALFEVLVYVEFVVYYKKRSGGDVVYLEQAYPKPDFLIPTTYAAVSVILSFMTSSATAFGTYILQAADVKLGTWNQRGVALGILTFAHLLPLASSKLTLRLSNFLGFVKLIFMFFIIITGFVVLGGGTRVKDPHSIFKNAWEGTTTDGNAISNAIIKVSFSYGGAGYVFGLAGEANLRKSKGIFKYLVPGVIVFVFVVYILTITSYYAGAESTAAIKKSGNLVASLYFQNVFGTKSATKALDVLVSLSALGHLLAVVLGHSRALREIGRQGVVPFPKIWTSIKPFGTPVFPLFISWVVNTIVLLAPPAGDAYNFIVDIGSYSGYIFKLILIAGLLLLRRQRKELGYTSNDFRVPLPIIIVTILFYIFVIAMAWVPPKGGSLKGSDVSFFYATYPITTIGILLLCVAYYFVWAKILPKIGHYEHRLSHYSEDDVRGHTVVQVKLDELEAWDAQHDASGRVIESGFESSLDSVEHLTVKAETKV